MKHPSWFSRYPARLKSVSRFALSSTLLVVGVSLALTATKNQIQPLATQNNRQLKSNRHVMHPALRLGAQEALANVESADAGPQYGLFGCQLAGRPDACYDPYQIRRAYGIDSLIAAGYDGTGHTIVIVDAYQNPNLVAQVAAYNAFYGLPATNLTIVAPDGLTPFVVGDSNMTGWAEEISLDVEWAHNMAPGAHIVLVSAKSNNDSDILSAVKYAVDHNLGDVISMSFGENESCTDPATLSAYHDVFVAATQKNITLFASAGDQGAAQQTCDGNSWTLAASSPADDPLVTGVGGTELHAAGYCLTSQGCNPATHEAFGTYDSEIVWNEGPLGDFSTSFAATEATGGGFSVLFAEPPYQNSAIHGGKQRGVSDVAYNAAILHGVLTRLDIPGIPAGMYRFGGTSCGAPQWAAFASIVNQKAGKRLGFLNMGIYLIASDAASYAATFHDTTTGHNSALEFDSSNNPVTVAGYSAGAGWDPPTGFGSLKASILANYLIANVTSSDGNAAINSTKPKPHAKPPVPGHMNPH